MIEKQSEALSILQVLLGATKGVGGQDMLDDVLPKPIDSPEELEEMSAGLSDEDVRKKKVHMSYTPINFDYCSSTMLWQLLRDLTT
jgi:hypothetical protein